MRLTTKVWCAISIVTLATLAVGIVFSALAALLVLVLWGAIGVTLHTLVRKPLAELTATTHRIRNGELSVRAPVHSGDELGELASSFNEMADELERLATTDAVTGLPNYRYANIVLDKSIERARSEDCPLSIVLGDIDGFKLLNDTHGHPAGDAVLKLLADIFRRLCGESAVPCRYGGDEFLVILAGADKAAAAAFTDRLRATICASEFRVGDGSRVPIRMSLGLASFPEDSRSKDHLLAQADGAMYDAKRLGGMKQEGVTVGRPQAQSGFGALDTLVQSIQYRDHYTKTHSDLVADYAAKLALRVGLSPEVARALRIAGVLHDVGKLIVPDDILKKPGPLTTDEYEIVKRHPIVGEMLIRETPFLEDVIQAVGCHHERYDGSGYPRGLKGEEIPLAGRIIAVADAYSALSLDRPYRKALSSEETIAQLRAGAGNHLDPLLVDAFLEMLRGELDLRAA